MSNVAIFCTYVEKGAWFKIGISMNNDTDEDITFYDEVEGVEVRIE